jgi:hypothetical protein
MRLVKQFAPNLLARRGVIGTDHIGFRPIGRAVYTADLPLRINLLSLCALDQEMGAVYGREGWSYSTCRVRPL